MVTSFSCASVSSFVLSCSLESSLMRQLQTSYPNTSCFSRAKACARGRPTYPRPTTQTAYFMPHRVADCAWCTARKMGISATSGFTSSPLSVPFLCAVFRSPHHCSGLGVHCTAHACDGDCLCLCHAIPHGRSLLLPAVH